MTCFNLFNTAHLLKTLCNLYNLEIVKIKSIIRKSESQYAAVLNFIEQAGIDFKSSSMENVFLRCKHLTTINDGFKSLNKYGLISLKDVLTSDTSLKRFLAENQISINVEKKEFTFKNKTIFLHDYMGDCIECYYNKCKYEKLKWDGSLDIEYKNWCPFREKTQRLSTKLYSHRGELEVHLYGGKQKILNYSCLKRCPEIFVTIETLVKEVFGEYLALCQYWSELQGEKYYCLIFDVNVLDFDFELEKEKYNELLETFNSSTDNERNFWGNVFLISKAFGALFNSNTDNYGQLLPSIKIPFENIIIEEFFN